MSGGLVWLAFAAGAADAAWERAPGDLDGAAVATLAGVEGAPHALVARSREALVFRHDGSGWQPVGGNVTRGGNVASRAAAVVDGRPWVAWNEDSDDSLYQVHVARWDGSAWQRAGGIVNHDPRQPTADVAIANVAGVPHVAWNERGDGLVVRMARFVDGDWRELGDGVGRRGIATRVTSVVDFDGRPHVAFSEQAGGDTPWALRVARWSGSGWEAVGDAPNVDAAARVDDATLAVADGALHVVWRQSGNAYAARHDGVRWVGIGGPLNAEPVSALRAVDAQGTLVVARSEGTADARVLRVARLRGDGSGFDEVAGFLDADPASPAVSPQVAWIGSAPHVAWVEGGRVRLAQLAPEFGGPSSAVDGDAATLQVPVATFGMPMDVRFSYGRTAPDVAGPTVRVTSPPSGSATATATVAGLARGAEYVWQASAGSATSPVARLRTAAATTATVPTPAPASTPAPAPASPPRTEPERAGPRRSVSDRVAPDRLAPPPQTPGALQPAPGSPGRASPSPSTPPAATVPGSVAAGAAMPATGGADDRRRRPRFAASLRRLDDLPLSAEDIARSFGLALLLAALLGLPARLFNATWKANRVAIAAFFAPLVRIFQPRRGRILLGLAPVSAAISALLASFLDPGFPSAPGSGAMYLGAFLGIGVLLTVLHVAWRLFRRRHLPEGSVGWHVYPGQIAFAATCVAVSRAAHFVPGLLMGMSGDFEVKSRMTAEQRGRRIYAMTRAIAVVALAAWVVSTPVGSAAGEADAGFALLVLDVLLVVVAVVGMEYLIFSGLPLVFLDGHDLAQWSRRRWAIMWGGALLWFSLVVLNPALSHYTDRARASAAWLATLLVVQAAIAVGLWAFFSRRARTAGAAARA